MIKVNGNYIRKEYDEMGNVEITFSFQHCYDKKKVDELTAQKKELKEL